MGGFFSVTVCSYVSNKPQCKGVICQTKFGITDDDDDVSSESGSVTVLERQSCWHFGTAQRERSTRPELRRFFLRWVFFQVDMIYDHDLHTFFSRFQIQSNEKLGSAIATSCHMHVRDSNFTGEVWGKLRFYLVTPKLVLTHTNYGKAGFTQSEFELHALSEVPGTPKMVLIPKTIGNRKRDCAWGGSWW